LNVLNFPFLSHSVFDQIPEILFFKNTPPPRQEEKRRDREENGEANQKEDTVKAREVQDEAAADDIHGTEIELEDVTEAVVEVDAVEGHTRDEL
jgi:hypothetical protein